MERGNYNFLGAAHRTFCSKISFVAGIIRCVGIGLKVKLKNLVLCANFQNSNINFKKFIIKIRINKKLKRLN